MTTATILETAPLTDRHDKAIQPIESFKPTVKVWLVDDNEFLRTHLGGLLVKQGGIECERQFSSPVELLNTLTRQAAPDVILLDVQMGPHNGLDAVRPIKQLAPDTRVLMFTTCFDTRWRYQAFQAGASDYLLKSYDLKRVADRIRCPSNDTDPSQHYRGHAVLAPEQPASRGTQQLFSRTFERLRAWWN